MPGYLTADGLDAAVLHLADAYPTFCRAVTLPEPSAEGRAIRALRIGTRTDGRASGVFFLAGVHAREVVNPDLLVSFGLKLCRAYANKSALAFGRASHDASMVQRIVEGLDLYLLPLANPDGRAWVQAPDGNPMWRKNRRQNPASPRCTGVDLNRNYDFLWSSGIGAGEKPCQETFRGPEAFSEPETRNVRHLLDDHANICLFVDLHSYSESVYYPWGDDANQSDDPAMAFTNPAYDGKRGTLRDRDYLEYIEAGDLDWFLRTAGSVRDAIAAARGTKYEVAQSAGLYPTSGCGDDYAYSRGRAGAGRKVMAFTVETGKEFQPTYTEAKEVMADVSAGLVAYCQAALDFA